MPCRVTEFKPEQVFAFETVPSFPFNKRGPQTRWRYELNPANEGTVLKESFKVVWYIRIIIRLLFGGPSARQAQLEQSLQDTLLRIKQAVEGS